MTHHPHSTAPLAPTRQETGTFLGLDAWEFRFAVTVVSVANGLLVQAMDVAIRDGWQIALINTFDISVIVWVSLVVVLRLLREATTPPLGTGDKLAGLLVLTCCLLPLGPFQWCVVAAVAVWFIRQSPAPNAPLARAAWLLLAVTVPMFWSKRLFSLFADQILAIDAWLVSGVTGTARAGNLVALPNGQGVLEIFAKCSSLSNVSLALLCWVLFVQHRNVERRAADILWCVAACAAVILLNTSRISLIGFYPDHYDMLHGPVGDLVSAWLSVFAVVGICHIGVGRGRIASA